MFLIAGLTTRNSTVDTGTFHCPVEGGTRRYRRMRARRWFTVFFIPLFPLGQRREWLQCLGCGSVIGTDVLDRQPTGRG